jgi:hypothetical protein
VPSASTSSVSSGVITGFGSVKLLGKEYGTSNTVFTVDGQPGSQRDLKVGMVVTVNGSLSSDGTRTANTITQEGVIKGAIQSIPSTNDRIVVLGQTVLIDGDTVPGQIITGLSVGDFIEVNGFVKGNGVIIAKLIEKKPLSAGCLVKGTVQSHDFVAQTFNIGPSLTIDYRSATVSEMPNPAGNAWNTLLVKVHENPCTSQSQPLVATLIQLERINVANADEFDAEGAITLFDSAASFTVNRVPVITTSSTLFKGGVAGDLALGVEVEVEGSLANGVLTAKNVSFRNNVGIEGDVATVTSTGSTPNLTLSGLAGVTALVDAQTEFTGGVSSLGQISVGDHVRVRGRSIGAGTLLAAEVEKRSPATQVLLEGTVQSIANPNVQVLGLLIDTSSITDGNFKGPEDIVIGRTAFFATVKVGALVKAKGNLVNGVVSWNEIEME